MNLKIKKIVLTNFKGIDFAFDLKGQDATIYGDNKTGKTSLMDATCYLFTDQNSKQQSRFNVKKLNLDGSKDYGQESSVEGTFIIDDEKELYLKKVFIDKWSSEKKKRAGEIPGETTVYYINDSENAVTKKQYIARLEEIAPMSTLKILLNPAAFPSLKPDEQRGKLMGMVKELSFEEICAAHLEISELPKIIGQYSVDEYRQILKGNIKKINEEKIKNPVKVKTAKDQKIKVEKTEAELKKEIKTVSLEINNIAIDPKISIQNKIDAADLEINRIKADHQTAIYRKANIEEAKKLKVSADIAASEQTILAANKKADGLVAAINLSEEKLKECREAWVKKDAEKHDLTPAENCPTCNKSLTPGEAQKLIDDEIKVFNFQKAENLKLTAEHGQKISADKGEKEKELTELNQKVENCTALQSKKKDEESEILKAIEEIKAKPIPPHTELLKKKEALQAELTHTPDKNNNKKAELLNNVADLQEELSLIKSNKRIDENIKTYKEELKDINRILEEKEWHEEMIGQYEQIRVGMVEGDINNLFQITDWKLFEMKKNGEVTPTCVALNEGVPYSTDLNDGHKKAVELDIVNTLSIFHNVQLPVFVDNCESITNVPSMNGAQVIKLIKPEITDENLEHYKNLTDVRWENK